MPRSTFQKLIVQVGNHQTSQNRLRRKRILLDVPLLQAVGVLANSDTHRSVSSQFGKTKGVEFFHYTKMIKCLRELAPKFIRWPSAAERDIIKTRFEGRYGYPGVVGCIDGTNVEITAPLEQPQRYINRHHKYSLLVQAVCDHELLYRDVYIGEPGSVGDKRMFDRSPLSENLLRRPDIIREDEHLLGDGAYVLTSKVLIPYVDDGHLSRRQRKHNYILSSCRSSVERSFALLKGKARRLKFFHNYSQQNALDHIMSSIMLHNFILLEGNEPGGLRGDGSFIGVHLDAHEDLMEAARNAGRYKREYIAQMLDPYEDDNED